APAWPACAARSPTCSRSRRAASARWVPCSASACSGWWWTASSTRAPRSSTSRTDAPATRRSSRSSTSTMGYREAPPPCPPTTKRRIPVSCGSRRRSAGRCRASSTISSATWPWSITSTRPRRSGGATVWWRPTSRRRARGSPRPAGSVAAPPPPRRARASTHCSRASATCASWRRQWRGSSPTSRRARTRRRRSPPSSRRCARAWAASTTTCRRARPSASAARRTSSRRSESTSACTVTSRRSAARSARSSRKRRRRWRCWSGSSSTWRRPARPRRDVAVERDRLEAEARGAGQGHQTLLDELTTIEAELRGVQAELSRAVAAIHDVELRATEGRVRREELGQDAWRTYGVDAAALLALHDAARDLASARDRVGELDAKLAAIGPVNLVADEEYRELDERLTFLRTQYDDLTASIKDLEKALRGMTRTAQDRFASAFAEINRHFGEIFQRLFAGGRAELR